MLRFVVYLCVAILITGCISKSKSDLLVREAYLAGQKQALDKKQNQSQVVIVRGDVKNEIVPWTEDMTVAKAILQAEYLGLADPKRIIVVHNDVGTEIKPSDLFRGKDVPLEPGDMVVLKKN